MLFVLGCERDKTLDSLDQDKQECDTILDKNLYYNQEIFQDRYLGIYNKWRLDWIGGGIAGGGYEADFDQLAIDGLRDLQVLSQRQPPCVRQN